MKAGVEIELVEEEEPRMETSTVFRLSENNRGQASLCSPRMVPIGPLHRNIELAPIKTHKERFLISLISRNTKLTLGGVLGELYMLMPDADILYKNNSIHHREFYEMLLRDGCFILELFFKWLDEDPDELLTDRWGLTTILSDLLLIENQIPFIVIEKLFDMVMGEEAKNRKNAFLNLLVQFLMNDRESSHISLQKWPEDINDILDLFHYYLNVPNLSDVYHEDKKNDQTHLNSPDWKQRLVSLVGNEAGVKSKRKNNQTPLPLWKQKLFRRSDKRRQIPGAVDLYEAGIKFKRKSSYRGLFNVTFDRGILEIPPLQIDSNKKFLFANLLALEKLEGCRHQTATSYITLMDSLINTKEDVALLQRAGIIHNKLSSDKEAAVFFYEFAKHLYIDNANSYFVELYRNVQLYYNSRGHQSWASLMKNYFNDPWAIISVIAGVILLGLTVIQTFFTVHSYFRPSSQH